MIDKYAGETQCLSIIYSFTLFKVISKNNFPYRRAKFFGLELSDVWLLIHFNLYFIHNKNNKFNVKPQLFFSVNKAIIKRFR